VNTKPATSQTTDETMGACQPDAQYTRARGLDAFEALECHGEITKPVSTLMGKREGGERLTRPAPCDRLVSRRTYCEARVVVAKKGQRVEGKRREGVGGGERGGWMEREDVEEV
jgi:hypothetical protein